MDTLPGLGPAGANNLGQYIPIAVPDTITYPGSDYYEIALREYTEKMHSDLLPTTLRGYVQINNGTDAAGANTVAPAPIHYLGPLIIAQKDRAVRVKFVNQLATGAGGNLFLPVDTTIMGSGLGPLGGTENYTQNRATLHLHGGRTPWISDGTAHQWSTPAGETTSYPRGVSVGYVPDMDGGTEPQGTLSFYWTNQQSSRLIFYHDHAYGITRLNAYAGEAAGYLLQDSVEAGLVAQGIIPADQIPLVIQDKTFMPSLDQLAATDPTWPHPYDATKSNLWFPHVFMPNQNPADPLGVNAMGRCDYGPWFWPPFTAIQYGPVPNPLAGTTPSEGPLNPGVPNLSAVPEAFMNTAVVNGTAYPVVQVQQKAYRFRILNACNDRFLNLQLYYAKSNAQMWDPATGSLLAPDAGEVNMVPAIPNTGLPPEWPTDGRAGGAPDPRAVGPSMIQIGSEGGFLPAPAVLPNVPIGYDYNRRTITVLNVLNKTLFLGPAERADVIVGFSGVPVGSKLILYNDAPAPVPAFDPRFDYYTGDPDQPSTGGAPPTRAGYGPNTRTIMQIQVAAGATPTAFNLAALQTALPAAYAQSQDAPIVPESAYNQAYGTTWTDNHARISDTSMTFTPAGQTAPGTFDLKPKAIIEEWELIYGRMFAILGVEIPLTTNRVQTSIWQYFADPPTEVLKAMDIATPLGSLADRTQIWKITHNGVDTHAIHWHMMDVQLIDRIGWDGTIKPPDPNEQGWKDTLRMNPLEDIVIALRPILPRVPWPLPSSNRPLEPTEPIGSTMGFNNVNPVGTPVTVTNQLINLGWEYVWHCHILGHEENDFMRMVAVAVAPEVPTGLAATVTTGPLVVNVSWNDASLSATSFTVQRATDAAFTINLVSFPVPKVAGVPQSYTDTTVGPNITYYYRVFASVVVGSTVTGYPQQQADSAPSAAVSVTTPNVPLAPTNLVVTGLNGPRARLTWTNNATNATGITVQRATDPQFTQNLTNSRIAVATSYTDSTVVKNVICFYRVFATNAAGGSAASNVVTAGPPAAPSNVIATQPGTNLTAPVRVTWVDNAPNAPVPPNFVAEANFTEMRAKSPTGPWSTITTNVAAAAGTGTTVAYSDNGVARRTTYYYQITATNVFGSSAGAFSNAITTR